MLATTWNHFHSDELTDPAPFGDASEPNKAEGALTNLTYKLVRRFVPAV
jgi:hypothetical protein